MKENSVFLIGNIGPMSLIIERLVDSKSCTVVGLCTKRRMPQSVRFRVSRLRRRVLEKCHLIEPVWERDLFAAYKVPEDIAKSRGIPVFSATDVRCEGFHTALQQIAPDLVIMAGFHRLLPVEVFGASGEYTVNIHPSLLPHHRGGSPNRWVLKGGENRTGVTVHLVDEKFDTGEIVLQKQIHVESDDTLQNLQEKTDRLSVEATLEFIELARKGDVQSSPQIGTGSYEKSMKEEDLRIVWSEMSHRDIYDTCRSMKPLRSGFSTLNGVRFYLWDLEIAAEGWNQSPGTVVEVSEDGFSVCCREGVVRVRSIVYRGRLVHRQRAARILGIQVGSSLSMPPRSTSL